MKTLKILAVILFMMIQVQNIYSYEVILRYPCINPVFPSPHFYPDGLVHVNFRVNKEDELEPAHPVCRIYVVQRNVSVMMYESNITVNEDRSVPINTLNFPNLGYNEPVEIKIVIIGNLPLYDIKSGYVIVYKEGVSHEYGSISNGSSQNTYNGMFHFHSNTGCKSLSNSIYYVNQYKISFTLHGNFRDSMPEVYSPYCQGYSGASPNNQMMWGYKEYQSDTEARFITFVYNVFNTAGQGFGNLPVESQKATIVYKFVTKPVIANLLQYPTPITITPGIDVGVFFCQLLRGNADLRYNWRDSFNIHNHQLIELADTIPYAVLISGHDNNGRVEPYRIGVQVNNEAGITPWVDRRVLFSDAPHGCPFVKFKIDTHAIKENPLLIKSQNEPGKDITDHYILNYPFLKARDSIVFSITEHGNDQTKIDEMYLTQINVPYGKEVGVTEDGDFISYTEDTLKNKVLLNGNDDVSNKLNKLDNETVDLKKDEILVIDFPGNEEEYISLRMFTPGVKGIDAATITTSNGEIKQITCRNGMSNIVIKVGKKPFTSFELKANKNIILDQISVVINENIHTAKKLELIDASNSKENIKKLVTYRDGIYANVSTGNDAKLNYKNKLTDGMNSFFCLSITGSCQPESGDNKEINKDTQEKFGFKLYDNQPNPFNPVTKIKFEIPETGLVRLTIYDISGREIKTLINEIKDAGIYESVFDGSEFASGVYFYKLQAARNSVTKRMILIK